MDSRNNRRLNLNPTTEEHSADIIAPAIAEAQISKEKLRALYQDEINLIIVTERELLEQRIKDDLQKKFDARVAELESEFTVHKKHFINELESLSRNFESLKESYEIKVRKDIVSLHLVIVESVMTCLTKIIGDASAYKDVVSSNIFGFLEKKSTDSNAIIRVSENEFRFLKKYFSEAAWIQQVRIDDRLKDGQMILDDGIASHYEIGFVNHLEAIKAAFIKVLQENHAI